MENMLPSFPSSFSNHHYHFHTNTHIPFLFILLCFPTSHLSFPFVCKNGKTALMEAAGCGDTDTVEALLAAGANTEQKDAVSAKK
jgi:hypothetical protein